MATISDVSTAPLSGQNYIDALLNTSPQWNYLTPAGNTIRYTFSTTGHPSDPDILSTPLAFSAAQQAATRTAMAYLSQVTGINFVETSNASLAQVHLANANIDGANTAGICMSSSEYGFLQGSQTITSYEASSYIYLDNVEWGTENANPTPGGQGYETLLHELGHMLGLGHPFDGDIRLPTATDNTNYTIMSYTHVGADRSTFSEYDIAALKWLYGEDGLGGALGIGSATGARYLAGTGVADQLTGTAFNDMLEGSGGNDILNGGAGTDTARYSGARAAYAVAQLGIGSWSVTGAEGTDTLSNIELLRFSDTTLTLNNVDTTAPAAPTLVVTKEGTAAASGNRPVFSGVTEAGAQVEVFNGATSLGTAAANASGAWSLTPVALANGAYSVTARATDAAGNASAASAAQSLTVSSARNLGGTTGTDTFTASAGNNHIDGGAGTDTVVYGGARADFTIVKSGAGYTVTDNVGAGGTDVLLADERIRFSDKTVGIDIDGVGGQAYRIYQAAFDRTPDQAGLGYWIKAMDQGTSLRDVAASFVAGAEFAALYGGSNPSNLTFVTKLYNNVLHRAPELDGLNYWLGILDNNQLGKAEVLAYFSEGAENQALVIGSITNGFEYIPFAG
ncbi:DUF4214 domain-containing protein [Pseudoduganella namucuonensis]|nr:DUF4214 domain-containing protein [Pseudoduganella namucuonensis]